MSMYRTVTVTATVSNNRISVTPAVSRNEVFANGDVATKVRVNNTSNYELLQNKPQIESVELLGNKTFDDLGLSKISNMKIEQIIGGLNNGSD